MKYYFLDTSALVKRYHIEKGTEYIDAVFKKRDRILISSLAILELTSSLNRKKLEGRLSENELSAMLAKFFSEAVDRTIISVRLINLSSR